LAYDRHRELKLVSIEPSFDDDSEYITYYKFHVMSLNLNSREKFPATPFSYSMGGVRIATLKEFEVN
jgi:hypothetical protein